MKTTNSAVLRRVPGGQFAQARALPGLGKLRAVVLLAGSVGTNTLAAAAGRPMVRFPVDGSSSVLGQWCRRIGEFARDCAVAGLRLRVVGAAQATGAGGACPAVVEEGFELALEADPGELRGTGGVVRDLAEKYGEDDYMLVAAAGQLLTEPLTPAVRGLAGADADVALLGGRDNSPGGLMLMRCGSVRGIPAQGFIDLKEQGLPLIARGHSVKVVCPGGVVSLPLRTRADYVRALRWYHRSPRTSPISNPFSEDWQPVFALWEQDAQVDPAARLHDSVVLAGGRVERGAMVVRSVVCPGAVVARNQTVVDQVIAPPRSVRTSGAE